MSFRPLGSLLLIGTLLFTGLPATAGAQASRESGLQIASAQEIDIEATPGALSPDGTWIAGRGEDDSLCLWATEGLTEFCRDDVDHVDETSLTWSPNGRHVAFSQAGAGFDSDIFIFDLRTRKLTNLTDDAIDEMGNPTEGGTYGPYDQDPVWSPDGDELLFRRSNQPLLDQDMVSLMRVRLETSQVIRVHDIVADEPFSMWDSPHWLPDDTIIFSVFDNTEISGLWRIGIDGANPQRIPLSVDERVIATTFVLDATPEGDRLLLHAWDRTDESDPELVTVFWLDLETATLTSAGAGTAGTPNVQSPVRLSRDASAYVFAVGDELDATIVVQDIASGSTLVIAEHAGLYG